MKKFDNFQDIETVSEPTLFTNNENLDKWWSNEGGIVIGSSIFLTGTSGAGKTTFAIYLSKLLNKSKTLVYSREMHRSSVKQQTERMGIKHKNLFIADYETCPTFSEFMEVLDQIKPKVAIIDSLQVVAMEDFPDENQERMQYDIIQKLRSWAKENNSVLIIIGHNKKDGEFRGANTIMQMFDAHIEMIHHKEKDFRTMAWGQKNRKGPLGTLYYEITKDSMVFYTKKEWESKHKKEIDFSEDLQKVIDSIVLKFKPSKKSKESKDFEKMLDGEIMKYDWRKFNEIQRKVKILEILSNKLF